MNMKSMLRIFILVFLSCTDQSNAQLVLRDRTISLSDLPAGSQKNVDLDTGFEAAKQFLEKQPNLVLDNTTLNINGVHELTVTLSFNRLTLLHNARIVTNGNYLRLYANKIDSDGGAIVAFDKVVGAELSPAAFGENGQPGASSNRVALWGEMNDGDILHVTLDGERGQSGGKGLAGTMGASGTTGVGAADHLFDCARSGGTGGPGAPGSPGGTGGAGGNGGDGGSLVLLGTLTSQREQVDYSAKGGDGGRGGEGGEGGKGSAGGHGGSGSTYCRGGNAGPNGVDGPKGTDGHDGAQGKPGSISAVF